jgi:multiple sugar transport system substrate-binding protein
MARQRMNTLRRGASVGVAGTLLLVMLLLGGCGGSDSASQSKIPTTADKPDENAGALSREYAGETITALVADPMKDTFGPVSDEFTRKTGIKVKWVQVPFADLGTRYATAAASQDSTYDVYYTWASLTAQFGPTLFQPLEAVLPQSLLDEFSPAALSAVQRSGTTYGLPYMTSVQFLYYNKDLFRQAGLDPDKPPETWDQFVEYGRKLSGLSSDGKKVHAWMTTLGDGNGTFAGLWAPALNSAGGTMYNREQTKVAFDSPEGLAAMTAIKDLFDAGAVDPASFSVTTSQDVAIPFAQGRLAMQFQFPLGYPYVTDPDKAKIDPDDVGLAIVPGVSERSGSVNGAEGFAIGKHSDKQQAALMWLRYMTDVDAELRLAKSASLLPPRTKVLTSTKILRSQPTAKISYEQGKYPADRFGAPWYFDAADVMDKWVQKVAKDDLPAQDAVDGAAKEVQAIMDKYYESQR